MQPTGDVDKQPSPTSFLAWAGFGCAVFGLACTCIAFASPFWLQTWPNSFNTFQNLGLWEICFHNYMHHKDDSQEIYSGCWWVFSMEKRYWKLRDWLLQPWYIACQVMVTGSLLVQIATVISVGMMFLHCCPLSNHEYHQTYTMFSASSLMFLVVLATFISGAVFGKMCEDREWMPRPDMNFLSWGYGFFIISGIMAMAAGACFYIQAKRTYEELLQKEEEYSKELDRVEMNEMSQSFQQGYGPPSVQGSYGPPPMYGGQYAPEPSHSSGGYKPRSDYSGGGSTGYPPSQGGYSSSGYQPSKEAEAGYDVGYAPPPPGQGYNGGGGYR